MAIPHSSFEQTPQPGREPKKAQPLSLEDVQKRIINLKGWTLAEDRKSISRQLRMKDFAAAVELIGKIASSADAMDHHPDLHLTGYRNLVIELSTHDAGGVTEKDFQLAAEIDELPKRLKT